MPSGLKSKPGPLAPDLYFPVSDNLKSTRPSDHFFLDSASDSHYLDSIHSEMAIFSKIYEKRPFTHPIRGAH
jgi:hypothetical protein